MSNSSIPASLSFLQTYLPSDCLAIGVSQLPSRNIFQSIADFFASKSGKNRICYVAVSAQEIKLLQFQGDQLLTEKTFLIDGLEHLELSEGSTDDGLIHLLHIHVGEIKSVNKKGIKKIASHYFKCMPPLLGLNTSPIQAIHEIQWAHQSKKLVQETLSSWPAKIEARLAEEFRIAEEIRRQEEEARRLIEEEKRLIREEKLRVKEELRQQKIEAKRLRLEEKARRKEERRQVREAKRQEKAEQSRLKQEEKERLREERNQQKAERN
jgi:hypothetical protein